MEKIITVAIFAIMFITGTVNIASAHTVYNNNVLDSNGRPTVVSVIPDDIWNAAMAKAMSNIGFGQTSMTHIARGGSVVLKDGTVDKCPIWYIMGCVIDPSLVR